MTKLGEPVPPQVARIRRALSRQLNRKKIKMIDADSSVTGRDLLKKIWDLIVGVPLGIAILTEELSSSTIANVFYEIGLLQALGKETLIVKTPRAVVPSDFVRTEYVEYNQRNRRFAGQVGNFLDQVVEQAEHYEAVANQTINNPALAIDYFKRVYLLTGDRRLLEQARDIACRLEPGSDLERVIVLPP